MSSVRAALLLSSNFYRNQAFGNRKISLAATVYKTYDPSENMAMNKAELPSSSAQTDTSKQVNRLKNEKSPYLLQHAHNPVDWYPWGDEAFEKAKQEDKLIFLSIGYSTCHWCHVMERESFADYDTAKIMNEHFINVKVDREERPDVDKIYLLYVTESIGHAGWPLSVFLTPDLIPISGGTYFPAEDKWGSLSFKKILITLAKQWKERKTHILKVGGNILDVMKKASEVNMNEKGVPFPGPSSWVKAVRGLFHAYEPRYGGFMPATKFPHACNFNFLFHVYSRNKTDPIALQCLDKCTYTLKKMANGGIYDHIAGGFARYSVDHKWHIPHFEKMLYDQAQHVVSYTDAYLATKDPFFAGVVSDVLKYVDRSLSHESGGFYSAEDADSFPSHSAKEKKEGAFCVWEYSEIKTLLDAKSKNGITYTDIFCHHFDVKEEGNCSRENDPHGELIKKNVLFISGSVEGTGQTFGLTESELSAVLEQCRDILFEARKKRPSPHLDSKMVCSWNALMISGLARAGQGLGEKSYIDRAIKAAEFINRYLFDQCTETLLRVCYKDEEGGIKQLDRPIHGFLEDYVFTIRAFIDLYEATQDPHWIRCAKALQYTQDELFWDEKDGVYYMTPPNNNNVILRVKDDHDGSQPCGNSVSCSNLLRFEGHYKEWNNGEESKAKRILMAYSKLLNDAPLALPEMCSALMFYLDGPTHVFINGHLEDPRLIDLVTVAKSRLIPGRVLIVSPPTSVIEIDVLSNQKMVDEQPTAYVCRGTSCCLGVTETTDLEDIFDRIALEIPREIPNI